MIKLIFAALIVLYLITRLYQIGQLPQTVYWDEASIGYNAYALTIDGRDEWGDFLPLHFRAFGEFKLPVYIYSTVPVVALLGLSPEAVRLPAVIFGLFILIGCYLIGQKLFNQQLGLLTILLMITSPWFLLFTRVGYEVSAGLAFFIWAIYFYLIKNNNSKYLIVSAICLVAAMYSYNSYRVLAPLVVGIGLLDLFKSAWYKTKSRTLILIASLLILFISIIPIYRLINSEGANRFQAVGLTRQTSQPLEMAGLFIVNYAKHFSPEFLFINGDSNPRSQVPGYGQLLWPSALLLAVGLFWAFRKPRSITGSLVWLLLIAPIPAALTIESPHALRSLTILPFLSLITGLGLQWLINNYRWCGLATVILILGLFSQFYWTFLTSYYPENKEHWQYSYYQQIKDNSTAIDDSGGQPYIFYLFYNRYDPRLFRQQVQYNSADQWGVSLVNQIGPVKFINNRQ